VRKQRFAGTSRRESNTLRGRREIFLLKEQLESELVVLRRGEPAIHQMIEADEEPSGMGTQGGPEDGPGEPADDRAKEKRPDARDRWSLHAVSLGFGGRIG
jgi:hypothetical protein